LASASKVAVAPPLTPVVSQRASIGLSGPLTGWQLASETQAVGTIEHTPIGAQSLAVVQALPPKVGSLQVPLSGVQSATEEQVAPLFWLLVHLLFTVQSPSTKHEPFVPPAHVPGIAGHWRSLPQAVALLFEQAPALAQATSVELELKHVAPTLPVVQVPGTLQLGSMELFVVQTAFVTAHVPLVVHCALVWHTVVAGIALVHAPLNVRHSTSSNSEPAS
jgi:hypothetical protein